MTHYIYKVSDSRIASILFWPVIFLLLMFYVIFDGINGPDNFSELSIMLLASGIFTIPSLLHLLNHYKYSKETTLEIVNKTVLVHAEDGPRLSISMK
jgi:hypothetical protein